jgi:hypothetical protein
MPKMKPDAPIVANAWVPERTISVVTSNWHRPAPDRAREHELDEALLAQRMLDARAELEQADAVEETGA